MHFKGSEYWHGSTDCLLIEVTQRLLGSRTVTESSLGRTVKIKAAGDSRQIVWEANGPILLSSCPVADGAGHSGEAQSML